MALNKLNIAQSLLVSNPQQSNMDTTTQAKPVAGSFMNVATDKIDFFDKNPRKHRDDESYEKIKASIRATGVQQPVHITQRPDSERFVLAQGGNTRLSIVKELWAETNDKRFSVLPCIFVEYTNETDIQINHLIENEQRQEMCFWDKAVAYSEIREIFQGATSKKLTLRECETIFATHGLSVSKGLLGWLFFANDKLQPLNKLAVDLSRSKVQDISATYNNLKKQCKDGGKPEQDFEDWFAIALRDFAKYAETETELDAEKLIEYLNVSFSDYFDIQTADLFEEEMTTDTADTADTTLPENTFSGSLNGAETATAYTPKERSSNGSGLSGSSIRTPRIPKEYSYGTTATVANDDEESATAFDDTPTAEPTRLPESGVAVSDLAVTDTPLRAEQGSAWQSHQNNSGSPNSVQESATAVFITIEEWRKAVHQKVKQVLNICYLGKCFVESDLFPLGFYIEYPDFELLKTTLIELRKGSLVIDYQHPDAGNIWLMLSVVSGQVDFVYNYYGNNNPILKLSDKSKLKQSLINPDIADKFKYDLVGDFEFRPYLSDKIVRWLSNTTGDKLSHCVQELFQTMQLKPHIEGQE